MVSPRPWMVAALAQRSWCWAVQISSGLHPRRALVRLGSTSTDQQGGRASVALVQKKQAGGSSSSCVMEALELTPPRGTRDFYPEEMRVRSWLFGLWRETSERHGFEEVDAPVLESEALYVRKAGEEVTEQLYCFEDKGGRRVTLRPEMTPSVARMVVAKQKGLALPIKWYSIPQCWRYERTTRGRRREHYQWNMDIFGVHGQQAEAEVLAVVCGFFRSVGLGPEDVGVKVNSRRVLGALLSEACGVDPTKDPARFTACCVLVDKLDKLPASALYDDFSALGVEPDAVERLVGAMRRTALDHDDDDDGDPVGSRNMALAELRELFELADAHGFRDYLVFDATVVRGLAYYTGLVFEGFDRRGELRAICGGGRYDKLLSSMYSTDDLPAVGVGFGDAVILELLKDKNLLPNDLKPPADVLAFAMAQTSDDANRQLARAAATVAATLRDTTRANVDLVLEPKKPKWAFKHADRRGTRFVAMLAPDEWLADKQLVVLKDLADGSQNIVPLADLPRRLQDALASSPPQKQQLD